MKKHEFFLIQYLPSPRDWTTLRFQKFYKDSAGSPHISKALGFFDKVSALRCVFLIMFRSLILLVLLIIYLLCYLLYIINLDNVSSLNILFYYLLYRQDLGSC